MVIVALLFLATAAAGTLWGRRNWVAVVFTWLWLPSPHFFKHLLGLPDTLHPNTYLSIFKLTVFSLAIAVAGAISGVMLRSLLSAAADPGSKRT